MSKLLKNWQNRKPQHYKAHKKLMRKLGQHKGKRLDQYAEDLHESTFQQIDCLDCANCCTTIPPIVTKTDVSRIAKQLSMKVQDFEQQYLVVDEDNDTVMNQSPCPFLLEDNMCFIYEFRPKACRQYPHTDNYEFSKHLTLHAQNALYCPAVFHILETMEQNMPT